MSKLIATYPTHPCSWTLAPGNHVIGRSGEFDGCVPGPDKGTMVVIRSNARLTGGPAAAGSDNER